MIPLVTWAADSRRRALGISYIKALIEAHRRKGPDAPAAQPGGRGSWHGPNARPVSGAAHEKWKPNGLPQDDRYTWSPVLAALPNHFGMPNFPLRPGAMAAGGRQATSLCEINVSFLLRESPDEAGRRRSPS